jgi:dehydrogenase/reductase SDR family protein 1
MLANKVALVTGATKGIGKGIALQLGANGAKVYITGRTLKSSKDGACSLEETANEVKKRGGICIPLQCDHENDKDVEQVFKRIASEQNGQLDILVNNAFKAGQSLFDNADRSFWELDPVKTWDDINNVGLRNHYICTVYAARLMVPRKTGLIVNITSMGGQQYSFTPAYGIGKAAVDRMSHDCGIELRKCNVACLSLLLGGVKTEFAQQLVEEKGDKAVLKLDPTSKLLSELKLSDLLEEAESPEFAGKVISSLATDPRLMRHTSKVVIAADYAQERGIRDVDNRRVPSFRQVNAAMKLVLPKSVHFAASFVPDFVKVPTFLFDLMNSKF